MNFKILRQEHDKENLYDVLKSFPNQIIEADQFIRSMISFPPVVPTNKVIVCGMGGSSLPVDIMNNIVYDSLHIHTCRTYEPPSWIDQNTLVIISSYSGNTEETLSALEIAKQKTSNIIVISAGGKLSEKAVEYQIPFFQIPAGIQPRCSTGYFLTYFTFILEEFRLIPDVYSQLLEVVPFLEKQDFTVEAQSIAEDIGDKLPIVYTSNKFSSLARIWKIKINENSKTQCFYNIFPELNHNEMVGFTNLRINPVFLIVKSSLDHIRVSKRMDIFEDLMADSGKVLAINMDGKTFLQQILSTLLLGDWISYYLALANEINPTPVDMVEEFKEKMKK